MQKKLYFNHPGFKSNLQFNYFTARTVTIETTLFKSYIVIKIKNVLNIMNRLVKSVNASFGSHVKISSVASLNSPEYVLCD